MSDSGPSTSTASPNEGVSSDLATTLSRNSPNQDEETTASKTVCCCDANTRKFASLAYIAFVLFLGVVILVAAKVDTDKSGIKISDLPVYRYLTAVLLLAILWMATFIFSRCCPDKFHEKWLSSHIEEKQLLPQRLLVGVMFFGLGSSFMTMVELLEFMAMYTCEATDPSMLIYYIVRTIFIYAQLYFFYKLSRDKKKILFYSHFLVMHLIAVNLGTWVVTFVYDSVEELNEDPNEATFHNKSIYIIANSSTLFMARHWGVVLDPGKHSPNSTNGTVPKECMKTAEVLHSTAKKMEPYLYTFTMEYCLISAGLMLNAWLSLRGTSSEESTDNQNGVDSGRASQNGKGYTSLSGDQTGCKSLSGDQKGRKETSGHDYKGKGNRGHKGQKGTRKGQHGHKIFSDLDSVSVIGDGWEVLDVPEVWSEIGTLWRFGFILGLVYIPAFTAIVFNVMFSDDLEQDRLIYIGMQFFFFLSVLFASLIGNAQLQKDTLSETRSKTHSKVDFYLLAVSLVGVFLLDMFIIIASICEAGEQPAIAAFLIVTNFTELLSSVAFTLFVRKALEHELPEEKNDTVTKSASKIREVVSFLFMLNICFWAMYTFEVKKSNRILDIVEQFFTKEVWFYLSHVVYPLAVFFHFHGAVCMVEILNHYSISKSKTNPTVSMTVSQPGVQA